MIKYILIALSFLAITACGSGNSGGGDDIQDPIVPDIALGHFLDSEVEGLSYLSGGQAGVTNAEGTFAYEVGTPVQFSIGGIVLGEATAKSVMTPMDLVEGASDVLNPTVTNIARFLQTLDNDADPENGTTITVLVSA